MKTQKWISKKIHINPDKNPEIPKKKTQSRKESQYSEKKQKFQKKQNEKISKKTTEIPKKFLKTPKKNPKISKIIYESVFPSVQPAPVSLPSYSSETRYCARVSTLLLKGLGPTLSRCV